jgi:outer membrane protein assembly factor BamB
MKTRTWLSICAGVVITLFPSVAAAEDWPAYDKDVGRSATSDERLTLPLGTAWVHETSQRPRPAWTEPGRTANMFDFDSAFQPVVAGGLVYFGSSADDTLYALDAADGSICWTFTTAAPIRFAPQIAGGRCYFAGDDGFVYCLDALTGSRLWQFRAAPENRMIAGNGRMISRWPCRSGVLVHDGTVFLTAGMWPAEGTCFYALDASTGKPKWCNDTLNAMYRAYPHDGVSFGGPTPQGYLLTDGKVLIVPTGEGAPAVLDAQTGRLPHPR